jgi:hypothetical protein
MLERLFPQQADDKLVVEDVFSTWLYTGNGSTQTITNGIDLAGKGGLVWLKTRDATGSHLLRDTVRGGTKLLTTNTTNAEDTTDAYPLGNGVQFNNNGFSLGPGGSQNSGSGFTYASWTFREAPKFFDVVTYTGDGTDNRQISHNLGVAPGFIIVKATTTNHGWACFHRGNGTNQYVLRLNSTGEGYTPATAISGFPVSATDTTFTVRSGENGWGDVTYSANASGQTYIAYLFAHDTASDGIIQCGSYTGAYPSSPTVTLGWEPQWVMIKSASIQPSAEYGGWGIWDNMRGMPVGGNDPLLVANRSTQEGTTYTNTGDYLSPTATGFIVDPTGNGWNINNTTGSTYIYMAIRRGPMRTPTVGTSVFAPIASSAAVGTQLTTNFPVDLFITNYRTNSSIYNTNFTDRLRGMQSSNVYTGQKLLISSSTNAETEDNSAVGYQFWNTGFLIGQQNNLLSTIYYNFRRAPGFMDVVCYTGTGVTGTQAHNLGVVPELMIVKRRTGGSGVWPVYYGDATKALFLNETTAIGASGAWGDTAPTATQFTVNGASSAVNAASSTYVSYLFASVAGVSKVGSYTGNGSSQTINCAFTTGARFVMIKRTDSTGDWYVWDSARGIVAGNDPYLALNTTAAEVTTNDSVDTNNTGFVVNQVGASNINVTNATYIYLAIA